MEAVLDRPAGTPEHWRGAHGDLTPWNLRRSSTGTWLIDWEDACWAPPGTDRIYFAAVTAATRPGPARPLPIRDEDREAARRWAGVVAARPADTDPRLAIGCWRCSPADHLGSGTARIPADSATLPQLPYLSR